MVTDYLARPVTDSNGVTLNPYSNKEANDSYSPARYGRFCEPHKKSEKKNIGLKTSACPGLAGKKKPDEMLLAVVDNYEMHVL